MKSYSKGKFLNCFGLYVLSTMVASVVFGATPSGTVKTWQEAANRWNIELTSTDELLLCINFTAVSGSIAYGAGDKAQGGQFVEMSIEFERELRKLHGDKTAELLLNATTAVMLSTMELAGDPTPFDEWELVNLYRCKDVLQRILQQPNR